MPTVRVALKERSYPVFIGRGGFSDAGRILRKQRLAQYRAVIVSQKPVADLYADSLKSALLREGIEPCFFIAPYSKSSESSKSQAVFLKLIRALSSADGKGRSLFLVALGGGVVGDLTGFAASVYRRGIPYVQVPTTLTSQVDSAIGGKTGIDLSAGKNLLGTFYQPRLVLADLAALESLPERHWTGGFAEVIKYGVIRDPRLFALLEARGLALRDETGLEDVIFRSARIKAGIVEQDEFDRRDVRIALNFGH